MAANNNRKQNVVRKTSQKKPTGFYALLGLIAVVGVSLLIYKSYSKAAPVQGTEIKLDPTVATGPAEGYTYGKADAPVKIIEFGDFECPGCGNFATVTEPDVRKRILDTGLASLTFYDFPLPMHKNTAYAHNAAACAGEQNKFWEMHDKLYNNQDQWNGEATDNPKPFFEKYAQDIGLNTTQWGSCYDTRKFQKRIEANMAEGMRRQINQTPTFIIGNKAYPGALPYDEIKRLVDEQTAAKPAATQ
jgi:protein-disulfide isomerase